MNLLPYLQSKYKEGSQQGQCFTFMHRLVDFPHIGTYLNQKITGLKAFGILIQNLDTIKIGDVLLLKYPVFGHGALVNDIQGANLQLTESNFNLDGKCHHTRQISIHDPKILGVFRGNWLFAPTPPEFPIQMTVDILMNNVGSLPWNSSLLQHMANLQWWFYQASMGRIQLIVNYKATDFKDYPLVVTGNGMDGLMYSIIKQDWMDANIKNFTPANIKVLNMPRSDWQGTVFSNPNLIELGYAYESEHCLPGMVFTVLDEHDDYPIYYNDIGAAAKYWMHEIMHLLYGLVSISGNDLAHNHLYGLNGFPVSPKDCFNDFDYVKLDLLVKP